MIPSLTTLKILQIVISIVIAFLVIIQAKGTGLSKSFSGFSGFYRTRRGFEKFVFILTIVLGIVFVANSLALILFN